MGFFSPKVRRTLKIVGSSEIGLGREPSYYKTKLKTQQAFSIPGRLREKRSDGHFQDLENNLVMSAHEVGSRFRHSICRLRPNPQTLSKNI